MSLDHLTDAVIREAIAIHRHLGPGAFESAYEELMAVGLARCGIAVERQVIFPIEYRGHVIRLGYRVDLVVDDVLFVELKCTERPAPIHRQQLLTYLRLARREVGLLINFGLPRAIDGITRVVNGYGAAAPDRTGALNG